MFDTKKILTDEQHSELFHKISKISDKTGFPAFVVGGYVRDRILGIPSDDIDVTIVGDSRVFCEELSKHFDDAKVSYFDTYGTSQLNTKEYGEIEFVTARCESYERNNRNPHCTPGTLKDDLSRRDLTINAMAISLCGHGASDNEDYYQYGTLVDMFGGFDDLTNKIARTPIEPHTTFSDDPLRMLRVVRFCGKYSLSVFPVVYKFICENAHMIKYIVPERIGTELEKMLSQSKDGSSTCVELLYNTKLLDNILGSRLNERHNSIVHVIKSMHNSDRPKFEPFYNYTENVTLLKKTILLYYIRKDGIYVDTNAIFGWQKKENTYIDRVIEQVGTLIDLVITSEKWTKSVRRMLIDDTLHMSAFIDYPLPILTSCFIASFILTNEKGQTKKLDKIIDYILNLYGKNTFNADMKIGEIVSKHLNLKPGKIYSFIKDSVVEAFINGNIDDISHETVEKFIIQTYKAMPLSVVKYVNRDRITVSFKEVVAGKFEFDFTECFTYSVSRDDNNNFIIVDPSGGPLMCVGGIIPNYPEYGYVDKITEEDGKIFLYMKK